MQLLLKLPHMQVHTGCILSFFTLALGLLIMLASLECQSRSLGRGFPDSFGMLQVPPSYLLVENVVGFEKSRTRARMMEAMQEAGYSVQVSQQFQRTRPCMMHTEMLTAFAQKLLHATSACRVLKALLLSDDVN